jgi:CRP/FNR family cyclic AMP-dependent transcriptional regulator
MKELEKDIESILPAMKDTMLFRFLSGEALGDFLEKATFYEFDEEEVICSEGSSNDRLFLVIDGSVRVSVYRPDEERDVYITTLGTGEIFGEAGIFLNMKRTASVVAADRVRLVVFTRTGFIQALKQRPNAGVKVLYMIIYGLLRKLREANQELAFERRFDSDQSDIDALIAETMPKESQEILGTELNDEG